MQLKKLELQGFKSFVDKTQITFEDGITSVVGPNGSGKSNISDALRWVLGEQSVKTLRGNKMGDVIFAGTQKRNPVGFCKVELVFDNEDKWLNMDFSEVAISRKYYKSGESTYYINNNECRLKDILELFRDTGVGKEGYSIIGQGQVTNIISSNTSERRMVFEAATGILKYKSRKSEAQGRLIKTGENIDRLKDLIDEISDNLEKLEVQSKDAKQYLEFKSKLRDFEIARFVFKNDGAKKRQLALKDELLDVGNEIISSQSTIENLKAKKEELSAVVNEVLVKLESIKSEHISIRESAIKSGSQTEVTFERIKGLRENASNLVNQSTELKDQIENTKETLRIHQQKLVDAQRSLEKATNEYNKKITAHELLKTELEEKSLMLDEFKQKRILFLNSVSEVKVNASKYNTMLESVEKRLEVIKEDVDVIKGKLCNFESDKSKLVSVKETLGTKKLELEDNKKHFQAKREEIASRKDVAIRDLHQCDVDRGSVTSKLNLLKNMQKEYEGYNFAVKNLMKMAGIGKRIRGTVADLIDVDKEYVVAIETALGGALQNVVTNTEEDAKALIEILKRENLGRATFLPISSVRPMYLNRDEEASLSQIDGVIGCAASLVSADSEFDTVIQKLLGRTVVVESIDAAIALMRKNSFKFQTVTLEGEIMHPGGAMSGGSKGKKGIGLLSRSDEIASLQDKLLQLDTKTSNSNAILFGIDGEIAAIEEAFQNNKQSMKEVYDRLDELQNEISIIDAQIDGETDKLIAFNEEIEQLTDNKLDIEDKLKLVSEDTKENTVSVDEDEINNLSKTVYELRQKNESSHEEISVVMAEKSGLEKDVSSISRDIDRLEKDIHSKCEQLQKDSDTVGELNREIDQLKKSIDEKLEANKETSILEEKLKKDIENEEQALNLLQAKIKENEAAIEMQRESIENNTDRKYKIEMESSKLGIETEMLERDMFERYDLTYEDARELKISVDLGVYKREIDKLKEQVKEMGSVNLNSIDEYAYTKARHEQITAQLGDLMDSKRDLEELIEMLQKDMTEQFKEQFALINANFSRIFKSLFLGGKAELVLNKDESVLECDIEIIAQPPGKKLQTISLLSGGEKSLTAIAILFAMLELKPTPFCVLDEIDSALDEANVYSFANYLKNYSDRTQFLVITHKRGVMELSDAIYGVAMQEKGVSKVVSIKIDDNKEGEKTYGVV